MAHRSWRESRAHLEGPRGKVKAECKQRDKTQGTCHYQGLWLEHVGVPGAKASLVDTNQKKGLLVSLMGNLA